MKPILLALALVAIGTASFADAPGRTNDMRFDSAVGHVGDQGKSKAAVPPAPTAALLTTRGTKPVRNPYAYGSRFGVGPNNDSR